MDPRIREQASIIADYSTEIGSGDNVIIHVPTTAANLAVALFECCGDRGANPIFLNYDERARRAYFTASDGDFETPGHELALVEETDVYIACRASTNATELADVAPSISSAYSKAIEPIRKRRLASRWCLTMFPAPGNAQLAGMSSEEYENFVWDAINRDWPAQRAHQDQLVDLLNPADTVRIISGSETDITMSIDGNMAINDAGEHNLPGGEVFTAPIPESVEGTVLFDKPIYYLGREITDAYLEFEDGRVVNYQAKANEDLLHEILTTDSNADRLGELGIGMNRQIDRFSYNTLFDEKMGDTVHLAVGMAYDECVGPNNEVNESAIHVDMIVDMTTDSRIELDGTVIQQDGQFTFESDEL